METHRHTQTHRRGEVGKLVPCTFSVSLPGSQKTCILWATSQLATLGKAMYSPDEQNPVGNDSKAKDSQKGESFPKLTLLFFSHLPYTSIKWTGDLKRNPCLLVEHTATLPQGKSLIINYLAYKWCTIKTQSHVMDFESTCFVSRYICFKPPFPKH